MKECSSFTNILLFSFIVFAKRGRVGLKFFQGPFLRMFCQSDAYVRIQQKIFENGCFTGNIKIVVFVSLRIATKT